MENGILSHKSHSLAVIQDKTTMNIFESFWEPVQEIQDASWTETALLKMSTMGSTFRGAFVEMDELTPLTRNILVVSAMVLYYKAAIEMACFLRINFSEIGLPTTLARNFLHCSFSFSILFWPCLDTSDGWSWMLSALLPAVVLARLVYKGVVVRDASDPDVQNLALSGSPSDLLLGPLISMGIFVWLTLYQFMTEEAAIIAATSFGDGCAPLVGSMYGRHFYSLPVSHTKTVEGSVVGVFLGTVIACYFNLYVMGLELLPLRMILAYGGIAAVAEGSAPGNLDNLIIPLVLHFGMETVERVLPG